MWGEEGIRLLREGISPSWEDWRGPVRVWVCKCVWVHTRRVCVCWDSDFTNMHAGIAFRWFWHSRHSFLWISSQREAHCSRALTSRGGSTLPSTFCLPLSHNPTHIWKWEEGNPRWWLKGFCCQGEFSPHLFCVCACVCVRVSVINVYRCAYDLLELKTEFYICWESEMVTARWNNSLVSWQKKWKPEWCCLSIYNLLLLAAMTVNNALCWKWMLPKWAYFFFTL